MKDLVWSIGEEMAGVVVITANPSGGGIALRDRSLTEVWDVAASSHMEEFDPRLLIASFGLHSLVSIEERFELRMLCWLLDNVEWCQWVDFEEVGDISEDPADIATVCDWLHGAGVEIRVAAHGLLLTPRMLKATASRLLEIEANSVWRGER